MAGNRNTWRAIGALGNFSDPWGSIGMLCNLGVGKLPLAAIGILGGWTVIRMRISIGSDKSTWEASGIAGAIAILANSGGRNSFRRFSCPDVGSPFCCACSGKEHTSIR